MPIRYATLLPRTTVEGPGTRFAVWLQGCSIRCPGCFNPHMWAASGGQLIDAGDLADRVLGSGSQGVTLLGGEPMEQAAEVAPACAAIRAHGLSVMTFTGHTLEHLQAQADPGVHALLAQTDLLVDGVFRQDSLDSSRPWVGSTNQRFHFLSPRYRHLTQELTGESDGLEIRVSPGGSVQVNGWSSTASMEALLAGLDVRRLPRTAIF